MNYNVSIMARTTGRHLPMCAGLSPLGRRLSVASALAIALSVVLLALAGCGDGGGAGTTAGTANLPERDEFDNRPTVQLAVVEATDSSHLLPVNDITYEASNLYDEALSTAWNVGAGVEPSGQTATLTLAGPSLIDKVEIANGYQKSGDSFQRSGRATFLLLTFSDGTSSSVSLEDREGWQLTDIADVVTETVTIKFIDIYPGRDRKLASAAVSEVRLLGKDLSASGDPQ